MDAMIYQLASEFSMGSRNCNEEIDPPTPKIIVRDMELIRIF
jgi:hypothetical protein